MSAEVNKHEQSKEVAKQLTYDEACALVDKSLALIVEMRPTLPSGCERSHRTVLCWQKNDMGKFSGALVSGGLVGAIAGTAVSIVCAFLPNYAISFLPTALAVGSTLGILATGMGYGTWLAGLSYGGSKKK